MLQAALSLAALDPGKVGAPISDDRLFDCINVILSYQNGDGGWATYENTRSYSALEVHLCSHANSVPPHASGTIPIVYLSLVSNIPRHYAPKG